MWLSICRRVMPACLLSGMYVSSGSSSDNLPASRRAMISTAVKVLLIDATRNWVSGPGSSPVRRSAAPAPPDQTMLPDRATAAAMPGTRCLDWRSAMIRSRDALVWAVSSVIRPRLAVGCVRVGAVRIAVLGPLEVRAADGSVVDVRGGRLRALVARLALDAGRPVGVNTLVDALWGDDP